MSLIERKLTEFFYRCESVRPQIIGSKKNRRRTSPVNSPLIDRLIPEETGAVYIIQGVDLNSDDRRHAHCTGLYKRHTPNGSVYCFELSDDERPVGDKLTQTYYVLSGLGLGGCEILPLEEELDEFATTQNDENSISYIKDTSLEFILLTISNDSIKFNNGIMYRWLHLDFGSYSANSDDIADFKPNGDPVITVMKTLDGRDFTRIPSPKLLVAIRDSLEFSSLVFNGNYAEYIAREMAQKSLLAR
jgi:hypothetical protein